ncbi:MAG: AMP-binding protein, partial [Candidatus Kariarchaeaceae archaeon]
MASETSPAKGGKEDFSIDDKPWLNSYPAGVPESIDYAKQSIYQYLEKAVKEMPNATAITFFDKKTKYKDFAEKVGKLATALKKLGVKKGDRVAIFLPNIPQFAISFFAVQKLGAVSVTFNPQYKDVELLYQLVDADIELIICLDYVMYQRVKKVKSKTNLKHIIVTRVGSEVSMSKRLMGSLFFKLPRRRRIDNDDLIFEKLIEENEDMEFDVDINPEKDLALLQYTGGTTGLSKGAMISHYNLVSNVEALYNWIKPEMEMGKEKFVGVVPMFHVYGLVTCLISSVAVAGELILVPDARAGRPMFQDLLETIAKNKPTIFHGVPTLYLALLMHPRIKDYDLTSLRACVSGSAPLPIEIMKNFEELTGAKVVEGYGLTETSPVVTVNPIAVDGLVKPGSIGLPFPDTEVKLFDPLDHERELAPDEEGELGVRGPQVMQGYWKRQEATDEVMNSQGFFLTGDIAKFDEDGYLFITDRVKDMINT